MINFTCFYCKTQRVACYGCVWCIISSVTHTVEADCAWSGNFHRNKPDNLFVICKRCMPIWHIVIRLISYSIIVHSYCSKFWLQTTNFKTKIWLIQFRLYFANLLMVIWSLRKQTSELLRQMMINSLCIIPCFSILLYLLFIWSPVPTWPHKRTQSPNEWGCERQAIIVPWANMPVLLYCVYKLWVYLSRPLFSPLASPSCRHWTQDPKVWGSITTAGHDCVKVCVGQASNFYIAPACPAEMGT